MPTLREVAVDAALQQAMRRSIDARRSSFDLDTTLTLEEARRAAAREVDQANSAVKGNAARFAEPGIDKGAVQRDGLALKERQRRAAEQLREAEQQVAHAAAWMPNVLDERVPEGGEEANQVVKTVGEPTAFDFEPRPHHELGEALGILDLSRAAKASGSRYYFVQNDGWRLREALRQRLYERLAAQGFQPVSTPMVARPETFHTSGYLPFGRADNFNIAGADVSLIGTSEQMLLGMHMNETLDALPRLYLGDSYCFRTESGSYGKDTAGAIRVHQFYKMEQVVYCASEDSEMWLQRCQQNIEWLLEALELPYQTVLLASGDLGAPAMIKYDCEGWFPAQRRYRELTSNSNLGDFQTSRGNIRMKRETGERVPPHTISATGFTDRLLWAILENYQTADGTVRVPDLLATTPYFDGRSVIAAPASGSTGG